MSNIKTCKCGNKINLNQYTNTCKVCSTVYRNTGEMLVSRHNWNIKDYFCDIAKSQSNLSEMRQN